VIVTAGYPMPHIQSLQVHCDDMGETPPSHKVAFCTSVLYRMDGSIRASVTGPCELESIMPKPTSSHRTLYIASAAIGSGRKLSWIGQCYTNQNYRTAWSAKGSKNTRLFNQRRSGAWPTPNTRYNGGLFTW
jgi:hypothetical protein